MTARSSCCSPTHPSRCVMFKSIVKKIMHGDACLGPPESSRTPLSDSPTHLLSNSGSLTLMKFASLSVATALARSVFPVLWAEDEAPPSHVVAYRLGQVRELERPLHCLLQFPLTLSSPPISDHFTSGVSRYTSLWRGTQSLSACFEIVPRKRH